MINNYNSNNDDDYNDDAAADGEGDNNILKQEYKS